MFPESKNIHSQIDSSYCFCFSALLAVPHFAFMTLLKSLSFMQGSPSGLRHILNVNSLMAAMIAGSSDACSVDPKAEDPARTSLEKKLSKRATINFSGPAPALSSTFVRFSLLSVMFGKHSSSGTSCKRKV